MDGTINLNCFSDGYLKYYNRKHAKIYAAVIRFNGRSRLSAKIMTRATDAVAYGDRLVERYERLKAAQKVDV